MFGSGLNEVYDFDTYRWSNWPQAAVSGGSWATCMVSWHDCLIVFGAADSAGLLNKVQLFNTPTSVSFSHSLPLTSFRREKAVVWPLEAFMCQA